MGQFGLSCLNRSGHGAVTGCFLWMKSVRNAASEITRDESVKRMGSICIVMVCILGRRWIGGERGIYGCRKRKSDSVCLVGGFITRTFAFGMAMCPALCDMH